MQFADEDATIDYTSRQWEAGADRMLRYTSDSRKRAVLERVVDGMTAELERRIGQTFTSAELVREYDGAERWSTDVAHECAPEQPWAWDMDIVLNATFHRFARRAVDYRQ